MRVTILRGRWAAAAAAAVWLAGPCAAFADAAAADRAAGARPKNLVLVLSDDHRYDAMSFLGHPFLQTPHMDSMARRGVHLRNAMVATALCSPSRASVLTGQYTHRHRVIDNNRPLPAGVRTFPELLQAAGYRTAFIGKWHMGGDSDAPRPGFDRWVSFRGQGSYLPTPAGLNVDGQRVPQKGYITDELSDYAIEWLEHLDRDRPFFLYLSHKAVHSDFVPAPRHAGCYKDAPWSPPASAAIDHPGAALQPRWMRDQRNSWHGIDFPYHSSLDVGAYYRQYCETIRALDDSLGRVLAWLDAHGLAESTVVLYMGDNGFLFGEHGLIDKRVAYEPSIRIPMLMQCPGLIPAGSVVTQVVANIDVAPTLLDIAGVPTPPEMDGRSFLPLVRGEAAPWRQEFLYVYYWEKNFPQSPTVFALRGDRFKYITYYGLWDTDELYDLAADPDESSNLIHDPAYADVAKSMEKRLYELLAETGGMYIPLNAPMGGSMNQRLGPRGGARAADFPPPMVVPEPIHRGAK